MTVAEYIDEVISESMNHEHALTYVLCLSKCQSVNSLNLVMQYFRGESKGDPHFITKFKFLDPFIYLIPTWVSCSVLQCVGDQRHQL